MIKYTFWYRRYMRSGVATRFSYIINFLFPFVFIALVIALFCCIDEISLLFFPVLALLILTVTLRVKLRAVERYLAVKFSDRPGYEIPAFPVTEQEYQRAKRIVEYGPFHPTVKELAAAKGVSRAKLLEDCELIIRNYNLVEGNNRE